MSLKTYSLKSHFPQLSKNVHGHPYLYLDTAATSLKPKSVIEKISSFYSEEYGTVHRALYSFSQSATHHYDETREKVRGAIGATSTNEIVFTRGTTESINFLAQMMEQRVHKGDVILISEIEHHSNIIPWQILCKKNGCQLKMIRVDERGELNFLHLEEVLKTESVPLISLAHVSNITGGVHPIKKVSELARKYGALLSVDGAQAVAHLKVDVCDLGADFYHFSSHKLYGPTGTGVLYGRESLLDTFEPVHGGGDMVLECSLERSIPQPLPLRFEAGTPHIAGVIGLGAALDFLKENRVCQKKEYKLLKSTLQSIEGIRIIGEPEEHIGICSFVCDYGHPMDIALLLDAKGIAVRSGHLCSQPALQRFGEKAFLRASLGLYNDEEDIFRFEEALCSTLSLLQ
jgi:cysteine desulfurase / selenocysteine lyase